MIATIEFGIDAPMETDAATLQLADRILDDILAYGKTEVAMKMPRGVAVYVKDRFSVKGECV